MPSVEEPPGSGCSGIPLLVDGVLVGGVGAAGAMTGAEDRAIAAAAAATA